MMINKKVMIFLVVMIAILISGCSKKDTNKFVEIDVPEGTRVFQSSITLDLSKKNEEISPLIYGQFIEHMERIIYEGLWAEMLDDRKFYFDIEDNRSPWYGNKLVSTDNTDPFVGNNAILFDDGGELEHRKLSVLDDKKYEGYVYLKKVSGNPKVIIKSSFNDTYEHIVEPNEEYQKYEFEIPAEFTFGNAKLIIEVEDGSALLGTISLMPSDNIEGMRKDTINLLKELNSPVYRWSGGNFVSGYNWKDGIGDIDRRAPKRNAEYGKNEENDLINIQNNGFSSVIEPNDFGIDEFLRFCEIVNAEPFVAVNTGLGNIEDAADLVKYTNSPVEGNKNPKYVKWWAVGNEMFGEWQLGYIDPKLYPERHNQFAEAMWEVDPDINLVAVGETHQGFTERMYNQSQDYMTHISEHTYWPHSPNDIENAEVLRNFVSSKINVHRELIEEIPGLKEKGIKLVFDEYAYQNATSPSELRDGLGVANVLHEFIRNSDIVAMGNYSSTINAMQGSITTTKNEAMLQGNGMALMLYRNNFGKYPITITNNNPIIDIVVSTDDDGNLFVAIVNPSDRFYNIKLEDIEIDKILDINNLNGDFPNSINNDSSMREIRIEKKGSFNLEKSMLMSQPKTAIIYKLKIK